MTNEELAADCRRYVDIGAETKSLEDERKPIRVRIVKELARRKKVTLEVDGMNVTLTSRRTGWGMATLKARLKPVVFRRVTKLAVDADAMKKAIAAGAVTDADIDAAELRGEDFPTITPVETEAKAA